MSKREKILVVVIVLGLAYAVYDLALKPKARPGAEDREQQLVDLENAVKLMRVQIAGGSPTDASRQVVRLAEQEWKRDPFLDRRLPSEVAEERARVRATLAKEEKERKEKEAAIRAAEEASRRALQSRFTYTGFLETGDGSGERLAVIDGQVYRVGEELEVGGQILESVHTDRIVLKSKLDGKQLDVPVLEE